MLDGEAVGDVEASLEEKFCACGDILVPGGLCITNILQARDMPGIIDGRLWWENTAAYWDLPFYTEGPYSPPSERDDELAGREQLFAIREGLVTD